MTPKASQHERLKAMLMLAFLTGVSVLLTACVQEAIEFHEFGIVQVQLAVDAPFSAAGVRVSLTGTGLTVPDPEFAFTDTSGAASIRTRFGGTKGYVVATHEDYEQTFGGVAADVPNDLGQPCLNVLAKGRFVYPGTAQTFAPDFLYPGSGIPDTTGCRGVTTPKRLAVRNKRAGLARFQLFVEDNRIIRQTFGCSQPVPGGTVFVCGSFNNFNLKVDNNNPDAPDQPVPLFDDGCLDSSINSGDDTAQDGVFTRVLQVPPGEVSYVFIVNTIPLPFRDPYEERSKRIRVVAQKDDRSGVQEVREIVASVTTVKDSSFPNAERPPRVQPPDPNNPPSNFQ